MSMNLPFYRSVNHRGIEPPLLLLFCHQADLLYQKDKG